MPVSLRSSPSIAGKPSYANRARNRCLRPVYAADFDVNGSADGDVCAIADVSYTNDTPDGLTRLEVVVRVTMMLIALPDQAGAQLVSERPEYQLGRSGAVMDHSLVPLNHHNASSCVYLSLPVHVQVDDFNGLLHSVAWVLKGVTQLLVQPHLSRKCPSRTVILAEG